MMNEVWRDIEGCEGLYQISNLGMVKSFVKSSDGFILKPQMDNYGYFKVGLYVGEKILTKKIHQLVAIAFLGHTPNRFVMVVDHIDFDRLNNHVDNLRIITARENTNKKHLSSSSKYTGVSWYKNYNKWLAQIEVCGRKVHLGYFVNEYDAHLAYEVAVKKII